MTEEKKLYQLIFQGPTDTSMKTLQKLKGTLIADLEYPIEDVQRFFKEAPLTILKSDSEEAAERSYKILKSAGANVLLVKPSLDDGPSTEAAETEVSDSVTGEIDLESILEEVAESNNTSSSRDNSVNPEEKSASLDVDDVLFNNLSQDEDLSPSSSESTKTDDNKDTLFPGVTLVKDEAAPAIAEKSADLPAGLSLLDQEPEEAVSKPTAAVATEETKPSSAMQPFSFELEGQHGEPVAVPQLTIETTAAAKPTATTTSAATPPDKTATDYDLTLQDVKGTSALVDSPIFQLDAEEKHAEPTAQSTAALESEIDLSIKPEEPKAAPPSRSEAAKPTSVIKTEDSATAAHAPHIPSAANGKQESLKDQIARRIQEEKEAKEKSAGAQPAAVGDEAALPAEEMQDAEQAAPPKKIHFALREYLPLIGICIVLLGMSNLIYFIMLDDSAVGNLDVTASELISTSGFTREKKELPELPILKYQGTHQENGRSFVFFLSTQGNHIKEIVAKLEIPAPPQLTPEDIVHKRLRMPWLYNIELGSLPATTIENNQFKSQAVAKAYVEYNNKRSRTTGNILIEGTFDPIAKKVSGEIKFFDQLEPSADQTEIVPEALESGKFRYFYKQKFDVIEVIPSPTPTAEVKKS